VKAFQLAVPGQRLSVLCLGAHSDDIEIGAGATILQWQGAGAVLDVHWCVLSAGGARETEARASAADFLADIARTQVETLAFRDGFFPAQSAEIKAWFEELKARLDPDVILTHRGDDAHQDHREVSRLTWNTFRDHLILEYEIPKWDGDLVTPNVYVHLPAWAMARKAELIVQSFPSQAGRDWFAPETFEALARIRGVESRAPERFAEGFHGRKLTL